MDAYQQNFSDALAVYETNVTAIKKFSKNINALDGKIYSFALCLFWRKYCLHGTHFVIGCRYSYSSKWDYIIASCMYK
ncbi:hypothetical protein CDAR_508911 [Caerostris darwini]|uniref:Uncharacterized protein n=1 Tax=Caerostris darwini TaxID=1538125 RepID=A0AAV4N082_9ARAC|nr:hypothetical protein CDAR_508911 [Caerostris darwini]